MAKNQWLSVLEGDKEAFLAFYEKNYQSFFSYGFRITANKELTKDCLQELFLELWRSRHTVNVEVKDAHSYLMTWLRRIISRRLKSISAQDRADQGDPGSSVSQPSYEELLVNHQSDQEKKAALQAALATLTPRQLAIIQARFFENKSFEDIASENSLAIQTVYNIIYKSLIILKQHMNEHRLVYLFLVISICFKYFF